MHVDKRLTSLPPSTLPFRQKAGILSLCGVFFFLPNSIAFTDICLSVLLLTFIADIIQAKRFRWSETPLKWPLMMYVTITIISAIFSVDRGKSFHNLTNLIDLGVFFLLFFSLQDAIRIKKGSALLLFSVTVAASYGIIQHYLEIDLFRLTQPVSFLKHLNDDLSAPVRISGFSSYMTFGGQLGMAIPLLFAYVLCIKERLSRGLWFFALIICSFALLWTYTRSAWLGAIGAILVIGYQRHKGKFLIYALGLFLIAGAGIMLMQYVQEQPTENSSQQAQQQIEQLEQPDSERPRLPQRQQTTSSGNRKTIERITSIFRTKDNRERLYTWFSTLAMIQDHPLTGIGQGNYSDLCWQYRTSYKGFDFSSDAHAHNNLLQVTVTGGVPLLLCFLWVWWVIFRSAYRSYRQIPEQFTKEKALSLGVFGATIAFFIQGFFEYNFGDSEVITMLWVLIAFSMKLRELHPASPHGNSAEEPNSCDQT